MLSRIENLTKKINQLKFILSEKQSKHFLDLKENALLKRVYKQKKSELLAAHKKQTWFPSKQTKREIKTQALNHVFGIIKNTLVTYEETKRTLQKRLPRIISKPPVETPAADTTLDKLSLDVVRYILTFLDMSADLSTTSKLFRAAINHPAYWRQLLRRDFLMPLSYFRYIPQSSHHALTVANVRNVYHRLNYLKKYDADLYNTFYKTLLESDIDFPPLTASAPSRPVLETNMLFIYFREAKRLNNAYLIRRVLENIFIKTNLADLLENKADLLYKPDDFIDNDSIQHAKKAKNIALLRSMLLYLEERPFSGIFRDQIQSFLRVMSYQAMPPKQLFLDSKATAYLNDLIREAQFDTAYQLLQAGVLPDILTLMHVMAHLDKQRDQSVKLFFCLLDLTETNSEFLRDIAQSDFMVRCGFFEWLSTLGSKNIEPIKKFHKIAKKSGFFDKKYLAKRLQGDSLLDLAISEGNLSSIQYCRIRKEQVYDLLIQAMVTDQLPVFQYFITRFGKAVLFEIAIHLANCHNKDIMKYLIEDLNILQLAKEAKQTDLKLKESCALILALPSAWQRVETDSENKLKILNYLYHEAPEEARQIPTLETLHHAVEQGHEAVVTYLIEACHLVPNEKTLNSALKYDEHEIARYLLKIHPALLSTLTILDVNSLLQTCVSQLYDARPVHPFFSWLMGPEAKKQGFQLDLDYLKKCIDTQSKALTVAMMTMPEFPNLFSQLNAGKKSTLLGMMVFSFPRSTYSIYIKTLFMLLKNSPDNVEISQAIKADAFYQALLVQDKELASLLLNKQDKFLHRFYIAQASGSFNQSLLAKFHRVSPHMLAWLEVALNETIPENVLEIIANHFATNGRELMGLVPANNAFVEMFGLFFGDLLPDLHANDPVLKNNELIKKIFLTALNHQRELIRQDKTVADFNALDTIIPTKLPEEKHMVPTTNPSKNPEAQDKKISTLNESTTTYSFRLFSTHSSVPAGRSLMEMVRQMGRTADLLSQIPLENSDFKHAIQQVKSDIAFLDSHIGKSEVGLATIPLHAVQRLQDNIRDIKQYLSNPSSVVLAEQLMTYCRVLQLDGEQQAQAKYRATR
jgi:hypothetical protein